MLRSLHFAVVAVAVELCAAAGARADDPAQQAHAMMRETLLERAGLTAEALVGLRATTHSASTIAREHMDRMRGAEAERAAHRRAVEHGTRRSGAGRPDREVNGAPASMHGGGTSSGSWGMDCQDAAGNWRTNDMHHDWMPGGGSPMGGMPTGASSSTVQQGAAQAPEQPSSR
jgi:hypothetical protein